MTPSLLTIAGTDPSGGAGIQVDLQVFRDWGFHGLSVITALVCQSTQGVRRFETVGGRLLADQLSTLLEDVTPAGVKIGMAASAEAVDEIASAIDALREAEGGADIPVVFDPVLASGSHHELIRPGTLTAMRSRLIPLVDVLTPNVGEAEALLDTTIEDRRDFERAAKRLVGLGCRAVLLKAGHLGEAGEDNSDVLADVLADGEQLHELAALARIDADVRGTGCQLSSALTAALAVGEPLVDAVEHARRYLNELLHHRRQSIGRGRPVIVRAEPYSPPLDDS